jgi:hypothetical protein
MVLVDKRNEHPDIARTIRFYNKHGIEIDGAVSFDPETGYGERFNKTLDTFQEFYFKGGWVEVENGLHNPDDTDMDNIRIMRKSRNFKGMTQEEKIAFLKDMKNLKDNSRGRWK